jgi:hypothetical protein
LCERMCVVPWSKACWLFPELSVVMFSRENIGSFRSEECANPLELRLRQPFFSPRGDPASVK